jgi:hypothetical protein
VRRPGLIQGRAFSAFTPSMYSKHGFDRSEDFTSDDTRYGTGKIHQKVDKIHSHYEKVMYDILIFLENYFLENYLRE